MIFLEELFLVEASKRLEQARAHVARTVHDVILRKFDHLGSAKNLVSMPTKLSDSFECVINLTGKVGSEQKGPGGDRMTQLRITNAIIDELASGPDGERFKVDHIEDGRSTHASATYKTLPVLLINYEIDDGTGRKGLKNLCRIKFDLKQRTKDVKDEDNSKVSGVMNEVLLATYIKRAVSEEHPTTIIFKQDHGPAVKVEGVTGVAHTGGKEKSDITLMCGKDRVGISVKKWGFGWVASAGKLKQKYNTEIELLLQEAVDAGDVKVGKHSNFADSGKVGHEEFAYRLDDADADLAYFSDGVDYVLVIAAHEDFIKHNKKSNELVIEGVQHVLQNLRDLKRHRDLWPYFMVHDREEPNDELAHHPRITQTFIVRDGDENKELKLRCDIVPSFQLRPLPRSHILNKSKHVSQTKTEHHSEYLRKNEHES